jgi:hypothetical protein
MYDVNKYKCYGYDEKNEDGSIRAHCVVAISTYAGKTVKGYAKCHPDDAWDWEKGKALAIARCAEKIAAKRNARATRKVAEAQNILAEAIAYLNDMLDYQLNSADELAIANAEVNKLISKM